MAFVYSIVGVTFVICLILTPIVIKLCRKYNIVDIPKDSRRVHSKPMPRIGGVAIVTSMLIGFLIYYLLTKDIPSIALNEKFLGYIIGGLIIATMGLIDDLVNLRARYKFFFQLAAGLVVYYFGIRITGIKIPFIYPDMIDFAWWIDLPLTLLWIIGVTNAINLIDGLDGLAAGITAISATSLLIIFIATSASLEAIIISAVLVGAVLGFLPYNFNPARTFIGDTGSNFLGYSLAIISILGVAKTYTAIVIVAPLIVLALPLFDTVFAIFRRLKNGKSLKAIIEPDAGHLHHKMLKKGFTQKQAVLILYGLSAIFGVFAIILLDSGIWKALSFALIIIVIIAMGYKEFFKQRLLGDHEENIENIEEKGKED